MQKSDLDTELVENNLTRYLWKYANDVYKIDRLYKRKKPYQIGRDTTEYHANKTDGVALTWRTGVKHLIISWVGTRSLAAWKENFDGIDRMESKYNMARVHEGFWEGFQSLRLPVLQACLQAIKNDYKIYITGHSRGGAMAIINTWDFIHNYFKDKKHFRKCIAFAAPMQGGDKYKFDVERTLGFKLLRVNTKYDRVPKLRMQKMLNYKHAGRELKLNTSKWPPLPAIRAIINHTQKCYTKYIERL